MEVSAQLVTWRPPQLPAGSLGRIISRRSASLCVASSQRHEDLGVAGGRLCALGRDPELGNRKLADSVMTLVRVPLFPSNPMGIRESN